MNKFLILTLLLFSACRSSSLTYQVRQNPQRHQVRNLRMENALHHIAERAGNKKVRLYLKDGRLLSGQFQGVSADSIWIQQEGFFAVSQLRRIEIEGFYIKGSRLIGTTISAFPAVLFAITTCGFGRCSKTDATISGLVTYSILGSGLYLSHRHRMRQVYIFHD